MTTPTRHLTSHEYQDAATKAHLWQTITEVPERAVSEQRQEIITAMKTVYWPAKEEIATNKYSSLLTLLEDVGVQSMKMKAGENATYRSYHTAEGMQESIRTVLH